MAKSLEQLIGYVPLTKAVQQTVSGVPNPLPPGFFSVKETVEADVARYVLKYGQRKTARLTQYGAASRRSVPVQLGERDVKLIHAKETLPIPVHMLIKLRNFENYNAQELGRDWLAYQIREQRAKNDNLRIVSTLMVLNQGVLYFDFDGELLPSSSGAYYTVSMQVNANNQNQLNGIFDVSWNDPNADIPGQLRYLKTVALQLTGREPELALYGRNVVSQLIQNDFTLDFLARNPVMNSQWLDSGEIPNGLWGMNWHPCYKAFWEDGTGVNREIWGANDLVLTPVPDSSWYGFFEGAAPVPNTIDVTTNVDSVLNNITMKTGMAAYGQVTGDPIGIELTFLDTHLAVVKNPDYIWQSTTVF